MAIFMVVLGIGYGCFVAISPLVLADLFGVVGLGSVMGVVLYEPRIRRALRPTYCWTVD